jgi:predicted nucleic acid-binding protein
MFSPTFAPMSVEAAIYLDSSALVKLVVAERESEALAEYLDAQRMHRVSCALVRVEVVRAVSAQGEPAMRRARQLVDRTALVGLDEILLDAAAMLRGPMLRSLDAIHIAAAQVLGESLTSVVTYDRRMATAAREHGLTVAAPE